MTMNKLSILLILTLFSCQEVMIVIPNPGPPDSDRVILIEEFTGASCPACPQGTIAIEEILDRYPENIVVVAVHSDFQGAPYEAGDLDLRTHDSDEIESLLGGWFGKPEAAVNRVHFEGQPNIRISGRTDSWDGFVKKELEKFSIVDLEISSRYNLTSRELNIVVSATALENLDGNYEINVLITESNIITAQSNGSGKISEFNQKHVLRKVLTDISGNSWFADLRANLTRERTFNFTLPDEEAMGWWVPENCNVVAYITDASTGEVVQAAEVHVVE